MTPQKLKNSLLWMAVQGKLSIQNHNETIAFDSDTWETNEEESFSIPENWGWKRFGFFGDLRMGKTILKSDLTDKGIPVYSATQSDDVLGYIKEAELKLHRDDLVIPARGNSIGYVTLVRDEIATCTQTTICIRDIHDICPEYLYWCCYAFKEKWFVFSGSAIPQVTVKQISQFMVPTPPLAEQKRIVAKIEELLPLIEHYEQAWSKLEDFNKRFLVDMQKSILQMAIQGKLVPQISEEGTGEELYQQIRAEKQALIKEGKIKKEKPLPEITEDEIPFDIPESWKWVRLESVLHTISAGKSFKCHETVPYDSQAGVVKVSSVTWGEFDEEESKTCYSEANWIDEYAIKTGDFLLSRANTKKLVGACVIVRKITKRLMLSDKILRLTFSSGVCKEYILCCLRSPMVRVQIEATATGTSDSMKNISQNDIRQYRIPLPPLGEQKRIVAKLEEILPLCERLK